MRSHPVRGISRVKTWEEAKRAVEEQLAPYFSEQQSEIRATILLRYHTFQAYGAAQYRALQEEKDIFPFWQYRSTGDGKVRDSHAALDGLVLPADDPFWEDHFPPWQYNCRCQVVGLMQEEVDAIREEDANRDPAKRLVLEGPQLEKLRTLSALLPEGSYDNDLVASCKQVQSRRYLGSDQAMPLYVRDKVALTSAERAALRAGPAA